MTTIARGSSPGDPGGLAASSTPLQPRTAERDELARLVRAELRTRLDGLDERTRHIAGYHLGYWDADGAPYDGGSGKGLRPALALLSARAAGQPAETGLPAAVAVELVHNFSLLHDDVIDGDAERRHRPTAWAAFGVGPAILAGDALLNLAGEVLGETAAPGAREAADSLATAVRRLIAGQAADIEFEQRSTVGLDECLQMARDKTAALLSCSAALGAVLHGAPAALTGGLAGFGERLGLAFQLVDDLLGIWGTPERTGKPVGSDLRTRKKSVPVVRALTSGVPAASRLAELYAMPGELTRDELDLAAGLIVETGAREWTEQKAHRLLAEAVTELDGLELPVDVRAELIDLARLVTGRDH